MFSLLRRACFALALSFAAALPAHAALDAPALQARLDALNAQGRDLLAQVRAARTPLQIAALQGPSAAYAEQLGLATTELADGTPAATPQILVGLALLSNNQVALSREVSRMGAGAPLGLAGTLLTSLTATYATILRLSDDIGVMADRIGEMADRILIMADKIGEMADRILVTQQIQSANYALAVEAILQTQRNLLEAMRLAQSCR